MFHNILIIFLAFLAVLFDCIVYFRKVIFKIGVKIIDSLVSLL